jgi:FkbM family methyltransferase
MIHQQESPEKVHPLPRSLEILRSLEFPRKIGILERLYGPILSSQGGRALVKLHNGIFWEVDLNDATHRWMIYQDYEGPLQMRWLKKWLSKGGVFVDSGANIGQMVASLSFLPNVRTLAFEPAKSARAWLRKCLSLYPEWDIEVIPMGLSDSEAESSLQLDGAQSTLRQDWYQSKELSKETISLTRLDAFTISHNIERIRLWKLDVEGHEVEAVKGARELLARKRIDAIMIECQTATLPELLDIFQPAGYSLFKIANSGLTPLSRLPWKNSFFGNLIAIPGRI